MSELYDAIQNIAAECERIANSTGYSLTRQDLEEVLEKTLWIASSSPLTDTELEGLIKKYDLGTHHGPDAVQYNMAMTDLVTAAEGIQSQLRELNTNVEALIRMYSVS